MINREYVQPEYTIIDGRRVVIAKHITETKYGRTYDRLDAPHGYKRTVKTHDGSSQSAMVYATKGLDGSTERYALVQRPTTDPLVAMQCFKLT
jgi:hypothetical protein